jgi:DNA-binding winged helix-turn-helix (wHTH) protein
MEGSSDGFRAAPAVDLAHIRPFHIGSAEVRPASREVACGSLRESLEPRVMQVLVTLARARGAILSRDDLIAACWDGRAVSDDAINRVLSRLRALARKFEAFQIETVVKVGYRLVGQVEGLPAGLSIWAQVEELPGRALGRRGLIAGSAAAVLIGTAGFLSWRPWQHRPPREAVDLFRRGEMAQREGMLDQTRQAISFFEQAVKIDPSYAEAWGALSLSYDHLLEGSSDPETVSLPARIRSAAGRALQLDPDNADAQLALVSIPPTYRHWVSKESALRRLAERFPRHWLVQGRMAVLLYQVGRLNDGFEFHKKALAIDPMLPIAYATLAQAMASVGLRIPYSGKSIMIICSSAVALNPPQLSSWTRIHCRLASAQRRSTRGSAWPVRSRPGNSPISRRASMTTDGWRRRTWPISPTPQRFSRCWAGSI